MSCCCQLLTRPNSTRSMITIEIEHSPEMIEHRRAVASSSSSYSTAHLLRCFYTHTRAYTHTYICVCVCVSVCVCVFIYTYSINRYGLIDQAKSNHPLHPKLQWSRVGSPSQPQSRPLGWISAIEQDSLNGFWGCFQRTIGAERWCWRKIENAELNQNNIHNDWRVDYDMKFFQQQFASKLFVWMS